MADNKRTAAYESIFGRPSGQHHRPSTVPPPGQYSQSQGFRSPPPPSQIPANYYGYPYQQPQQQQGYTGIQPQGYYPNPYGEAQPRRPYTPSISSASGAPYAHQFSPSQQYLNQSGPPPPPGSYRSQLPPHLEDQPTRHSYSSSIVGAQDGVLSEPSGETNAGGGVPPGYDGLTPAQAYQAQVYQSQSSGRHSGGSWQQQPLHYGQGSLGGRTPSPLGPSVSPVRNIQTHYNDPESGSSSSVPAVVPKMELPAIDVENGSLGIDFPSNNKSNDVEEDFEDSTLPYMHRGDSFSSTTRPYAVSLQLKTPLSRSSSSTPSIPTVSSPDSSSSHHPTDGMSPTKTTTLLHRLSTESIPTISTTRPAPAGPRTVRPQDRSQSMSAASTEAKSVLMTAIRNSHPLTAPSGVTTSPTTETQTSRAHHRHTQSQQAVLPVKKRPRNAPLVYPALLSKVAEAFRSRVPLSDRTKDGLTYTEAFDGREAVDTICFIIKTGDRCLALLLGRALDSQKFFHDVVYEHRLRDSVGEVYQFGLKDRVVGSKGMLCEDVDDAGDEAKSPVDKVGGPSGSGLESSLPEVPEKALNGEEHNKHTGEPDVEEDELPIGVFTLLTDCYSPTCTRDRLCYSIACPRRLEQQSRLNLKQEPGLKRSISRESLGDLVEPGTLWVHSVPQEIVDSVSETEKKRQEAINEVMYTERDFVRDMEYLRDVWIKPLQKADIIPEERRQDFLSQVFWNVHDIISVNTRLRDALNKRQKSFAVVEKIGDILLDAFPHFGPFVSYGAHQLYGKYEFEKEKASNPAFTQFVEETERRPESRKLELNGYLTKPTTRLARYPLLLEVVLKYTADDNPDKAVLPQAIKIIRDFLQKVNVESGKTENRFNLLQLDQHLVFRPGEFVDLKLKDEGRELLYKGPLKRTDGGGDVQVFLFDHALLMVKQKTKHDQHKVYRRPIPLGLLAIAYPDDSANSANGSSRSRAALIKSSTPSSSLSSPYSSSNAYTSAKFQADSKNSYPVMFTHLGRHMYQVILTASTWVARKKWIENIQKQQERIREQTSIFGTVTLNEGFFSALNKVHSVVPFNGGRNLAFGSTDGVYFFDLREPKREPVKVVGLPDVKQLDVLDDYQLLIVLCDNALFTFPLDALDPRDPSAGLKRAKKISGHTTFFKAGICLDKTLVCLVKASALSSTVKVMEPIDFNARTKNKPTFRKVLQGGNDTLKVFREFYIPVESSSIHFLRTKVCVGCEKGFEIVDLKSLETQPILHPDDTSLDFVQKRDVCRPQALYRIDQDFLLCYEEFAFYIDRTGCRARRHIMINWEGSPTAFALHYPYLLAFEPNFVEVRHVETGQLSQIITGTNIRCLFAYEPPSQAPQRLVNETSAMHHPNTSSPYNSYPSYSQYGMTQYNQFGAQQTPYGTSPPRYPYQKQYGGPPHKIIMISDESVVTAIQPVEASTQ